MKGNVSPAIAALLTAATLIGCSSTTSPGAVDVSRRQMLIVPAETVEQLAQVHFDEQKAKAAAAGKLVALGPQFERVQRIVSRLQLQTPTFRTDAPRWHWEIALINDPILNASCSPGGKIILYTGLINQLTLSDDELAMVLGHEIAHALREHGRERVSQAVAQNVITQAALGAMQNKQGQVKLAGQVADVLYVLPNSRANETEADKIGLELAARAGFNPEAAVTVWEKMGRASQGTAPPAFLSTHPGNDERIAELRALIPTVMPLYNAAPKT